MLSCLQLTLHAHLVTAALLWTLAVASHRHLGSHLGHATPASCWRQCLPLWLHWTAVSAAAVWLVESYHRARSIPALAAARQQAQAASQLKQPAKLCSLPPSSAAGKGVLHAKHTGSLTAAAGPATRRCASKVSALFRRTSAAQHAVLSIKVRCGRASCRQRGSWPVLQTALCTRMSLSLSVKGSRELAWRDRACCCSSRSRSAAQRCWAVLLTARPADAALMCGLADTAGRWHQL